MTRVCDGRLWAISDLHAGFGENRELVVAGRGHIQADDPYRPGAGPVQGAHQVQQGRLARPRRPDDREQFASRDGEAHPAQRLHGWLAGSWSPPPASVTPRVRLQCLQRGRGRRAEVI
jgi:hypothetical protein